MTTDPQNPSSAWDERYQQQPVETMPWFYPELDDDLAQGQCLEMLLRAPGA